MVGVNDNVAELDYGCGPSSATTPDTNRCEVYGDDGDYEDEKANDESDEDGDDESNGDIDVQADEHLSSFHTFNQVLENEQGIYVSMDAESCDVSNNPDVEDLDKSSPVQYHLAQSPQFENVENFGNALSSDWTPWVKYTTRHSCGEFVIGQVLNSKSDFQEVAKFTQLKHTKSLWLLHPQKNR